jgi:transcriptional regulator with XRE-family HTH domain
MKDLSLIIGNRIIELRKERGISQEQLALKANVTRSYMGALERGEKNISVKYLKKIIDALGVDFQTFFIGI